MSQHTQQQTRVSFQWLWNWKILLFTAFFLPLTVSLALWQLERAAEKELLLENHLQRGIATPVSLSQAEKYQARQYLRVQVKGEYDNRSPLLLDNRVRHGRPGFEVISLFKTVEGRWLLINRGWLLGNADRSQLPLVPEVQGVVLLTGYLYRSPGQQLMLGEDIWAVEAGPKIIQNASPEKVAEKLAIPLYDYSLRLDEQAPGALETGWDVVNVQPGKHIGYAVQWSAMAIVLVVLTLFASSNLGDLIKSRRVMGQKKKEESNDSAAE